MGVATILKSNIQSENARFKDQQVMKLRGELKFFINRWASRQLAPLTSYINGCQSKSRMLSDGQADNNPVRSLEISKFQYL